MPFVSPCSILCPLHLSSFLRDETNASLIDFLPQRASKTCTRCPCDTRIDFVFILTPSGEFQWLLFHMGTSRVRIIKLLKQKSALFLMSRCCLMNNQTRIECRKMTTSSAVLFDRAKISFSSAIAAWSMMSVMHSARHA